jgi:hypothetical protein
LETALLHALTALPHPNQQRPAPAEAATTAVQRRVWTIPARSSVFTGRGELLAEVEAALQPGKRTVVQAVTGMGGIGKTTTAIEYAHRHHDEFDIAWWVPTENPALLQRPRRSRCCTLARSAASRSVASWPAEVKVIARSTRDGLSKGPRPPERRPYPPPRPRPRPGTPAAG